MAAQNIENSAKGRAQTSSSHTSEARSPNSARRYQCVRKKESSALESPVSMLSMPASESPAVKLKENTSAK